MPGFIDRLFGGRTAVPETKSAQMLMAIRDLAAPDWTRRSFPALAQGVDLPAFDGQAPGSLLMEALAIIFLRQGIKARG